MTVKYDDAEYHTEDLDEDASDADMRLASVHIGVYLRWLMANNLVNVSDKAGIDQETLDTVLSWKSTGTSVLWDLLDGTLVNEDLTVEGRAFSDAYYDASQGPSWLRDWTVILGEGYLYAIEETPEVYARAATLLDIRYAEWRASR